MSELIGVAVTAIVVLGAWAYLAHVTHKHASEAEQNAREQEKIRLLALKALGEGKHGKREAA